MVGNLSAKPFWHGARDAAGALCLGVAIGVGLGGALIYLSTPTLDDVAKEAACLQEIGQTNRWWKERSLEKLERDVAEWDRKEKIIQDRIDADMRGLRQDIETLDKLLPKAAPKKGERK